jgi:uncharacterized protein with HEPN domain
MAKLKDLDFFHNIHLGFCRILYYTENFTKDQLQEDIKTQDAVAYCLQQIGRNANKLSYTFKKQNELDDKGDWLLLAMFDMDNFFMSEDLWEMIYDDSNGLAKMFRSIHKIDNVLNGKTEKASDSPKIRVDDLPLTTNYRYPIHTKSSIWTVRKR